MGKSSKHKNGKVPKITEEEYAKYLSSLKAEEVNINAPSMENAHVSSLQKSKRGKEYS